MVSEKRVAFFLTGLNSGGIENYLLRFLKYTEGRFIPIVICKGDKFGDLYEEYKKIKNIRILNIYIGRFSPFSLYSLYKRLKKLKVEVVCDFTGNFSGFVLLIARLCGIKKRLAFYRNSRIRFKKSPIKLFFNRIFKFLTKTYSTKILSNSTAALDYFYPNRKRVDTKYKVIYNGIDSSKFITQVDKINFKKSLGIPENSFVVGHVGRYNSQKNHNTILEVGNELFKKYDDIYMVLCGKETDLYLPQIINKRGFIKERFIILGYREDVNKVMQVLNLYFFPSTIEGQPNALIEAMISGLPIVASNIQPILETTPAEVHSKLKEPFDITGFVNEIENAYLNENYRKSLIYTDWAKNNFDPDILFNLFLQEL